MEELNMIKIINGHFAKEENVIAFCHLLKHRGYMTRKFVKSHDCIAKKCLFFEKVNPEYWESQEQEVIGTKNKRLMIKKLKKEIEERNTFIKKTLEENGHIYVTAIKDREQNILEICYIYDERKNLTAESEVLRKKLNRKIKLTAKKGSHEAIEILIRRRDNKGKQKKLAIEDSEEILAKPNMILYLPTKVEQ